MPELGALNREIELATFEELEPKLRARDDVI